jgi:phosphosulfolactate phosphohydrolase-like enzyme
MSKSLIEGATRASGAVAIIDMFRAFTTAAVALANGASRIIMVSAVEPECTGYAVSDRRSACYRSSACSISRSGR